MSSLTLAALAADLAATAFAAPPSASLTPRRIGAEVELIPVESATWRRCPIAGDGCCATLPFLRRHAARQGWAETRTAKGTPCFTLPEGGTLTFEPGGQLEYSSPPARSPSALLALLRSVVLPLRAAAGHEGITLLAVGIDPANSIEGAPLFLRTRRYERMAEYLARRGPAGARMMRQTAAFQVSLDVDDEPWLRWRVLNAAAPYVVAIFANSSIYAGEETGCVSSRAQVWRALDPWRTGLPWGGNAPIETYLDFALEAPAILLPAINGEYLAFGDWLGRAEVTLDEWHDHLTTLFPEVRPRGHFELRSADAVAPQWYAAPLALAAGLCYEPRALRAAADLLGAPDLGLLELAGRVGLRDDGIARTAVDLVQLALDGCAGLGPGYFHPADLEQAVAFFDRYTRRGRCPADDRHSAEVAA
ncbi:MAG TPA: glutamate-cysteine ligase family protein [Gemmatimonadales bacterium]|nr:glutamate-cysteine ligase family protein [Gemmatimonadales bacterium]